jgi:hypothetical protein
MLRMTARLEQSEIRDRDILFLGLFVLAIFCACTLRNKISFQNPWKKDREAKNP